MSISDSRASYEDCFEILDQALESDKGVRVQVADGNAATNYRGRLHYARKIDRRDSKSIHAPDSPDYGKSVYDKLIVTIDTHPDSTSWVYIRPLTRPLVVEDL